MTEREKENQHRWLKMQAKHAAIQVILETLIIETNREGSHPTSTKRVGRSVGGGQKGLQSASANLTGNADHLNREGSHPTSTKRVERSVGAGGQKLRLQ
jgi:hypothetical protein